MTKAMRLAAYVRAADRALARQTPAALAAGAIAFPAPVVPEGDKKGTV
jgi:hypothetical protein